MIETIHIQNVQSHKDSVLRLSPGLNVIKGTSHNGKSSILRAIKWCLRNKPRGEGLKSHFAEDSDPMSVAIEFDNGYVIRNREKNSNSYEVSGIEGDLEAIGTEVPKEVTEVTKLNEVNISDQHSGYFFLQSTPGEIAKSLNELVGLSIIDESLKRGNSIVRDAKKRIEICKEDIEKTESRLEKYEFLEHAETVIRNIERNTNQVDQLKKKVKELSYLISEINKEVENKEDLRDWLTVRGRLTPLEKKVANLEKIKVHYDALKSTVDFINKEKNAQKRFHKVIEASKDINAISNKINQLKILRKSHMELACTYADMQKEVSMQNSLSQRVSQLREQLQQQQKTQQTCPTCGAYKEHWRKEWNTEGTS